MIYASIGSISHGTLRTEDLLDTFASVLQDCVDQNEEHFSSGAGINSRAQLRDLIRQAEAADPESEDAEWLVDDLADALEEFAPPYCYFGTHEGDGSDFGFWPCMDMVEELPRVQDSDEAKALGEDCVYINDHGNVTVYGGDGCVIWDCV